MARRRAPGLLAVGALVGAVLGAPALTAARPAARPEARPGKRARPGKVVRVERNPPRLTSTALVCPLIDGDLGTCHRPVSAGAVGVVLDSDGAYGRAEVLVANELPDACGPVSWNIEIDQRQLTTRDYSYSAVLVLDHAVTDTARALPPVRDAPAGRPGERVLHVLDDDGDGLGDLMITSYACDEPGRGTQSSRPLHTCIDTWLQRRDQWRHARTDLVPTCY